MASRSDKNPPARGLKREENNLPGFGRTTLGKDRSNPRRSWEVSRAREAFFLYTTTSSFLIHTNGLTMERAGRMLPVEPREYLPGTLKRQGNPWAWAFSSTPRAASVAAPAAPHARSRTSYPAR